MLRTWSSAAWTMHAHSGAEPSGRTSSTWCALWLCRVATCCSCASWTGGRVIRQDTELLVCLMEVQGGQSLLCRSGRGQSRTWMCSCLHTLGISPSNFTAWLLSRFRSGVCCLPRGRWDPARVLQSQKVEEEARVAARNPRSSPGWRAGQPGVRSASGSAPFCLLCHLLNSLVGTSGSAVVTPEGHSFTLQCSGCVVSQALACRMSGCSSWTQWPSWRPSSPASK